VQPLVRPYEEQDAAAVVELSLRAWAPVFASLEQTLGPAIFGRLHPDWKEDQRRAVENVCASQETRVWIAEANGEIVGFVATGVFDPERAMGEISILAVDPDHQASGIGTALTEFALDRLAEAGMRVAMVETGGDPGHAPARRTYEGAGFTLLPIARYFKNL
jgi:ribosomal protein S18 acetylase RimI-like enzyme